MIRGVLTRPAAATDIRDISTYLAGFSPRVAELFEQELWHAVELLTTNPEIGAAIPGILPMMRFTRVSQRFRRYLIFYGQPDQETLEIVRILHGARERSELLRRG